MRSLYRNKFNQNKGNFNNKIVPVVIGKIAVNNANVANVHPVTISVEKVFFKLIFMDLIHLVSVMLLVTVGKV